MLRVQLLRKYVVVGGAAYNEGEIISLDDRRALDLVSRGIGIVVPLTAHEPTPPLTTALSDPPEHRMMPSPSAKERRRGK